MSTGPTRCHPAALTPTWTSRRTPWATDVAQATTNATGIESAQRGASASAKTTATKVCPTSALSTRCRTRWEIAAALPHLTAKVTGRAICGDSVKENQTADYTTGALSIYLFMMQTKYRCIIIDVKLTHILTFDAK